MFKLTSAYRASIMLSKPTTQTIFVKFMEARHLLNQDAFLELIKTNLAILNLLFIFNSAFIFLESINSSLCRPLLLFFPASPKIKDSDSISIVVMSD